MPSATLLRGLPDAVPAEMRIAHRGLELRMPEPMSNHRKVLAGCERTRPESVTGSVDACVLGGPSQPANHLPRLRRCCVAAGSPPVRGDPGTVHHPRNLVQHPRCLRRERDLPRSRPGVRKHQLARLEIHLLPTQMLDLPLRHSVGISHRSAATAWGKTRNVVASTSDRPRRLNSSGVRNLSRVRSRFLTTRPHGLFASAMCPLSSVTLQMRDSVSRTFFAISGLSRNA